MNSTNLPYGSGSVIYVSRNALHPYCARKYRGNNANGNPVYKIIGYYATREEAVQALANAIDETGEDLARADMTFRELLQHHLESNSHLSKSTLRQRKGTAEM